MPFYYNSNYQFSQGPRQEKQKMKHRLSKKIEADKYLQPRLKARRRSHPTAEPSSRSRSAMGRIRGGPSGDALCTLIILQRAAFCAVQHISHRSGRSGRGQAQSTLPDSQHNADSNLPRSRRVGRTGDGGAPQGTYQSASVRNKQTPQSNYSFF